jgi:hypothetical protein
MIEASAPPSPTDRIEAFIARWQGREGGQERANYAMFLSELCAALDLDPPEPADATRERNNYVFERVRSDSRSEPALPVLSMQVHRSKIGST